MLHTNWLSNLLPRFSLWASCQKRKATPVVSVQAEKLEQRRLLTQGAQAGAAVVLLQQSDIAAAPVLNATPTISMNSAPVTFVKGPNGVFVAPSLTISDASTDPELQIPGGQIIISLDAVGNKKRTKAFDSLNLDPLKAVGTIGNFQLINGRAQATVDLSDSATTDQIQDALRDVIFFTEKRGLKFPTRTIEYQVIDKALAPSTIATQTIHVLRKTVR